MSNETLADMVSAALTEAELCGYALADPDNEAGVVAAAQRANRAAEAVLNALPRYEAALRWAEAWAAREDATKALIAKPDHDECMAYSAAQDELQAAAAAYREARS